VLSNKKIIVTGCGRGMGEATFLAYVKAGAQVVGMDIDSNTGHQVLDAALTLRENSATFIQVDVASPESVERAFQEAVSWLGGELHVLAHPAAIQAASDPSHVTADAWDRMFAVNVRGTMLTNQAADRLSISVQYRASAQSRARSPTPRLKARSIRGLARPPQRGAKIRYESMPYCPPSRPRCTTKPCRE
jgi:NAD(P)-dependent dehydrogenase (short-subunit alcohol dehydrogenase family)